VGTNGLLDSIDVADVRAFVAGFRGYLASNVPQYSEIVSSTNTFTAEAEALVKKAVADYTEEFKSQKTAA
jgi:F-type H+-transporting ATPase subunit alpha